MNDKPKCNARVSSAGDFRRHACGKTAAYSDEAGVPNTRCKTHSAQRAAEVERARNARWQTEPARLHGAHDWGGRNLRCLRSFWR